MFLYKILVSLSVAWTKILGSYVELGISLVKSELGTWITSSYFIKGFLLGGRPSTKTWLGGRRPHVVVESR